MVLFWQDNRRFVQIDLLAAVHSQREGNSNTPYTRKLDAVQRIYKLNMAYSAEYELKHTEKFMYMKQYVFED